MFAKDAERGDFPEGTWKCNCFVMEVLDAAGVEAPMYKGNKWPIKAEYWANSKRKIPGWAVVDNPRPGDVAAFARNGESGHVGIFVGGFGRQVIAAQEYQVEYSDTHFLVGLGFRGDARAAGPVVFRRWMGTP